MVPVGAIVEMLAVHHLGAATFRIDPVLAWTQAVVVVLAALGGGLGLLRRAGSRAKAAAAH